jgi:hypothetical protein
MAQTCNRCGTIANDDAYFCPHCSNKLAGPTYLVPAVEPHRSRFPLVLLGLGLCLIVGVGAALAYIQLGQIQQRIADPLRPTSPPAYVSVPTFAPDANYPPAGVIWFGSSFDATTFAVHDQADSFAVGVQVALVAHSSQLIPEGKKATLSFDGYDFQTQVATAGGFDTYGMVIDSVFLTPGKHTAILKDLGGNELARGTLTIGS